MRKPPKSAQERFEDRIKTQGWFAYVPKEATPPDQAKFSARFTPWCPVRDWKCLPLYGLFSSIEQGGLTLDITMNEPNEWAKLEEAYGKNWLRQGPTLLSDGSALEFRVATISTTSERFFHEQKEYGCLIVKTDIHPALHVRKLRRRISQHLAKNPQLAVIVARQLKIE